MVRWCPHADTDVSVTVQTCGDLGTIRPLVEGQPSTEFPLQTVSVPSNVNSYMSLVHLHTKPESTEVMGTGVNTRDDG